MGKGGVGGGLNFSFFHGERSARRGVGSDGALAWAVGKGHCVEIRSTS